jgi:hypothetical protein
LPVPRAQFVVGAGFDRSHPSEAFDRSVDAGFLRRPGWYRSTVDWPAHVARRRPAQPTCEQNVTSTVQGGAFALQRRASSASSDHDAEQQGLDLTH